MTSTRTKSGSRFNLRIIGLVAIGFAVFLGAIVFFGSASKSYTVAVANQMIPAGGTLATEAFTMVPVSGDQPALAEDQPSQMLTESNIDTYRGQMLTNTVYPGEVLQAGDFFNPSAYDPTKPADQQIKALRLSDLLPKNARGILLYPAQNDPTSTFVQAGDLVDVYWVPNIPSIVNPESAAHQSQKLFTKRVLFVLPRLVPAAGQEGATDYTPTGNAYLLDLTDEEAGSLSCAMANGDIRLALAGPNSDPVGQTVTVDPTYFPQLCAITSGTLVPSPSPSESPAASSSEVPSGSPAASPSGTPPALPAG